MWWNRPTACNLSPALLILPMAISRFRDMARAAQQGLFCHAAASFLNQKDSENLSFQAKAPLVSFVTFSLPAQGSCADRQSPAAMGLSIRSIPPAGAGGMLFQIHSAFASSLSFPAGKPWPNGGRTEYIPGRCPYTNRSSDPSCRCPRRWYSRIPCPWP